MQAASELVFGREVMLQAHGHGKYKHTLADGSYRMVRTSITRSPKTARAGGIGSMRWEIWCWKD